eukprot:scaffold30163_cov124-Isochrysis_galbana.AAC.6
MTSSASSAIDEVWVIRRRMSTRSAVFAYCTTSDTTAIAASPPAAANPPSEGSAAAGPLAASNCGADSPR